MITTPGNETPLCNSFDGTHSLVEKLSQNVVPAEKKPANLFPVGKIKSPLGFALISFPLVQAEICNPHRKYAIGNSLTRIL